MVGAGREDKIITNWVLLLKTIVLATMLEALAGTNPKTHRQHCTMLNDPIPPSNRLNDGGLKRATILLLI